MDERVMMALQAQLMEACSFDLMNCFVMKLAAKNLTDKDIFEVFELFGKRATDGILSHETMPPLAREFSKEWVSAFIAAQVEEMNEAVRLHKEEEE